jgi:hypothetical protein
MGNKELIKVAISTVIMVLFTLIVWYKVYESEPQAPSQLPQEPEPDSTILVVKAISVDNEPGAYILEYSNGAVEILHADGTRDLLEIKDPHKEDKSDVQSVRPRSDVGERSRDAGSPS